jgi:chromosome segregation ATPase
MQLLLAQLSRIERSIEALPALLARLDSLTESTRQLEAQWRETARELATRDDQQQQAISSMGLRLSELMAAVAAISAGLQDQKGYAVDVGKRVVALEQAQAALFDFKNRHEDALRRIGQVERQVETALD